MDWQHGRQKLLVLLHKMMAELKWYINSVTAPISQPATLLRTLKCIQRLIGRNFIFEFHEFATITLQQDVYPKIVHSMFSSGTLTITDNLIYFSAPISDLENLQNISFRLGSGEKISPKAFLLQNSGFIGVSHAPSHAGSSNRECYLLEHSIRDVLINGIDEFQEEYRLRYIDIAFQSLQYLLEGHDKSMSKDQCVFVCLAPTKVHNLTCSNFLGRNKTPLRESFCPSLIHLNYPIFETKKICTTSILYLS